MLRNLLSREPSPATPALLILPHLISKFSFETDLRYLQEVDTRGTLFLNLRDDLRNASFLARDIARYPTPQSTFHPTRSFGRGERSG